MNGVEIFALLFSKTSRRGEISIGDGSLEIRNWFYFKK